MKVTIDNKSISVPEGATILDAAHAGGIDIPTLCHLPGQKGKPSCLLCVVKVQGTNRLLPSCSTMAADGMIIENDTSEVQNARRTTIEMLLSDHLGDCLGPCSEVCPAHLNTPQMMRQIANGQFREAIITVKESIALPAILGRICPELCEKGCRRTPHDGAVSICLLKRFAADTDLESNAPYIPECAPATGKNIAIVGAGPAGLSAAYYLQQYGHQCTLYDKNPAPGGMIRYAISQDILPHSVIDAEIGIITRLGVKIVCNICIGDKISLEDLRREYDAVLLTTGDVKTSAPDPSLPTGPRGVDVDRSTYRIAFTDPGKAPVWAAGGVLQPLHHAIRASADGAFAAKSIDHYLADNTLTSHPVTRKEYSVHIGKLEGEQLQPYLRMGEAESRLAPASGQEGGYTAEEAIREAKRCLSCDCAGAATCSLRHWAHKCNANSNRFKGGHRTLHLDTSHPEVVFDSGKCIACGICIRIAASQNGNGISFIGRGFDIEIGSLYNRPISETLQDVARSCALACPTAALTLRNRE